MSEEKVEFGARGRRKMAVARVTLSTGAGKWIINRRPFTEYFPSEALRNYIEQPLKLTNMHEKFDVTATVTGGGLSGQAGAGNDRSPSRASDGVAGL